jgi:predicted heme/steroid binding protein
MNKFKTLVLSASAMFVLAACGGTTEDTATEAPEDTTEQTTEDTATQETFTVDELSEYDGQDGNDAYVAVDGVVYDVTDNDAWTEGEHAGQQLAGTDATDVIAESPHGDSVLEGLPVVGNLE